MATEDEVVEVKLDDTKTEEVTAPELTQDEQLAVDHGWRPKEEWTGDPDDWIPAREFNRRGELFARIAKYGNENKEMRESLKKLFEHNRKLYDAGYKKAMTDLKQQKLEAVEENDARKLMEIDDQMESLRTEHQQAVQEFNQEVAAPTTAAISAEHQLAYEQFCQTNTWYGKNADLTKVAENLAKGMVESARASGKQIDYTKMLNEVAKEVRDNNPQYFSKERKTSDVDSGGVQRPRGSSGSGRYSMSSIPQEEREIARTIIASTGMKEEEYVKQYLNAQRN